MATNSDGARNTKYVTMISGDGFEFVVLREACLLSPTIKGMLRGSFSEAKTGRCVFPEITGPVLEKVVEYLYYYHKNVNVPYVPDMEIPVELCLVLLEAADYFQLDKQMT
ncbi:BTB/POZ protein [Lasiosphaeris hirsuta]|uniref:Elongin-C n=1 Tax=Lasiosphaeris hirsuta TaxID=260670 RepID=A0AA40DLE7_9PEZI|nr:BTB/POZ protein [Lasiosphaeris hirsuta]